jgi:hypothetical protein
MILDSKTDGVLPLQGELAGEILVLHADVLDPAYRVPQLQLWKAIGGFGCSPGKMGRAVFATCLHDGETMRWNIGDFLGIASDDLVARVLPKKFEVRGQSGEG